MSVTTGPYIVGLENNLQFYLDGAGNRAYPGTGTLTNNLITNGIYPVLSGRGNLTNGASISTIGKGSFYFDGVNDQIRYDQNPDNTYNPLLLPEVSTCYAWIYPLSGTGGLFSHWSGGPVNLGYQIYNQKISVYQYYSTWTEYSSTGTNVPLNTWSMITWVRNSSTSMSLYLNDTLNGTLTPNIAGNQYFAGGNQGVFGSLWGFQFFNGYLGYFSIYNVAHSLSDVQNQYNTFKGRYGL